jgi:hypothetical protein
MNPEPFPSNPPDLEAWLARRPCPEPAEGLRDRFLQAALAEPNRAPRSRDSRSGSRVWYLAAAVLLALNAALGVDNGFRYQALHARATKPADLALDRPEPRDEDDAFRTIAAAALARLTPAPDAGPLGRLILENTEN